MGLICKLFLIVIASFSVISCCTLKTSVSTEFKDYNSMLEMARQSFVTITSRVTQKYCFGPEKETPTCSPERKGTRQGSGVIIAHDNKKDTTIILTVAHVCKYELKTPTPIGWVESVEDSKMVTTIDGKKYQFNVIQPIDTKLDICIIETKRIDKRPVSIVWKNLKYGEKIFGISNAGGLATDKVVPVEEGRYYGTKLGLNFYTLFSSPGSSGGPIINTSGQLVGLISHIYLSARNISVGPSNKSIMNFLKTNLKNRASLILSIQ